MSMSVLKCQNVTVKYENQVVISGVSFEVSQGDYLCIVGDNGTGKTTLLKAVLGLKRIQSGSILFDPSLCRNEIGYISQQNNINRDFPASVYEVVLSGCLNKHGLSPLYSHTEKNSAKEIMKKLGIDEIKVKSFQDLSGGQQRRVLLARAMMASSKVLFLDEPVAALDPIATADFYDLLNLLRTDGLTIIMVSHDIHSAIHNASHILHLSADSYFHGTTAEYISSSFGQAYLNEQGTCRECHHELTHGINILSSDLPV